MKKETYIKIENFDNYDFLLIKKFKNGDCFCKYPCGYTLLCEDEHLINDVYFYAYKYGFTDYIFDYPECVTEEEKTYILKFFKDWEEQK